MVYRGFMKRYTAQKRLEFNHALINHTLEWDNHCQYVEYIDNKIENINQALLVLLHNKQDLKETADKELRFFNIHQISKIF